MTRQDPSHAGRCCIGASLRRYYPVQVMRVRKNCLRCRRSFSLSDCSPSKLFSLFTKSTIVDIAGKVNKEIDGKLAILSGFCYNEGDASGRCGDEETPVL